ncbi:MAG: carbamate kinase [Phycisphaerales bacterium]|nr:carbamate kinase [Phycisphaerales bacterium]
MSKPELLVLALGGNAISPEHESADIDAQFERTRQTVAQLDDWIGAGHGLVIVHGNGPQVGAALRRVELSAASVYRLPLHICVADTQGGMGFMIARCVNALPATMGVGRVCAAVVTSVEIDPADPAFSTPTKPIGDYLSNENAARLRATLGWTMAEIPGHGFRRVVASPAPRRVVESAAIKRLVDHGTIVIAGGGGGVPVSATHDSASPNQDRPIGIDAVIDKDATAALLAIELGASRLVFATAVRQVFTGWGTPRQQAVDSATAEKMREWLSVGEFPAGSMGPKVSAALQFMERSRDAMANVVICASDELKSALRGVSGTRIAK